ncbi:cyclase family protein [Stigmatella sp. ncwal1]|uniref:Cyclase family protein n=1 Tax=Stigmatella ashevillensis TaxID=2995309 RepID=A0ABT5DJ47_9BACT|nr:cyclase family protein [Stigmatella ashevillena]MDC0713158.1 cyclase family protein [Stigmatella ashevillena]
MVQAHARVPTPPWPAGDERGMANTQGPGTWLRCAQYLNAPHAKVYELSHLLSNAIPMSPYGPKVEYQFRPTAGLPGTRHAFNGESVTGDQGSQGTQLDSLGHFGYLPQPWSGQGAMPTENVRYYGGFRQADVKPTPQSPLLKLGLDKMPPVVTSAVLLDARHYMGKGQALKAGQRITPQDIEGMLRAQGLGGRGLLPGDVLYIYTGWEENWSDPTKGYYMKGPGLSYDAAKYLTSKAIVLVSLDCPFIDPAPEGFVEGNGPPAEGTPPGMPYAVHHQHLTQAGIYQIENAHLKEMAADKVWTSCTMILPLRLQGGASSPIRPVAIGTPGQ